MTMRTTPDDVAFAQQEIARARTTPETELKAHDLLMHARTLDAALYLAERRIDELATVIARASDAFEHAWPAIQTDAATFDRLSDVRRALAKYSRVRERKGT